MKVKLMRKDGLDERALQGSSSLQFDREYVVLELYCQADGRNYFRIEYSHIELPALFDARLFMVTDSRGDEEWRFRVEDSGSLTIGPAEWKLDGFWEALMDQESWAYELYSTQRDLLIGRAS